MSIHEQIEVDWAPGPPTEPGFYWIQQSRKSIPDAISARQVKNPVSWIGYADTVAHAPCYSKPAPFDPRLAEIKRVKEVLRNLLETNPTMTDDNPAACYLRERIAELEAERK